MGRLLSLILLLLGVSCTCGAKVSLKSTKPFVIPVDNVTPKMTTEDVAKIVPTDLPSGSSEGMLLTRMVDKGVSLWFNSEAMKQSSIGRIAEETQEKLKTDLVVPADSAGGVSHKFSFRVEAFQALAKLEYSGWMKAAINYDAKSSATDILFHEKVFENKDLVLTHRATREQRLSMIGLAWAW